MLPTTSGGSTGWLRPNRVIDVMGKIKNWLCLFVVCLTAFGVEARNARVLQGCLGTYHGEPRLANGRVDLQRLLTELADIRANTYSWLIWERPTDWDDLKLFLPLARAQKIKVWVNLVPPSESPPHASHYSEPFRLDYARWGIEIARLSLREKNLVAWSIDDFPYDLDTFTPEAMRKILTDVRAINPRLAFVPCCYFSHLKAKFIQTYAPMFDGILFPYRDESGRANTTNANHVISELKTLRERLGRSVPIIVDVYASKHSQHAVSNVEYVEAVMIAARQHADGVMIYRHQHEDENPEKYRVVKKLFNAWAQKIRFETPGKQGGG
jgi:hypothetical protein